jgi:hypothetical protein
VLFNNSIRFGQLQTQALQEAQVDQDIDQRVLVGDGGAVAQMWPLDAQGHRLRIDPLNGGALAIEGFVQLAVAVERVTQARADTDRHHGGAALLLGVGMMKGTAFLSGRLLAEGTHLLAALMFHEAGGAIGEGELERHRQASGAQGQARGIELASVLGVAAFARKGYRGETAGGVVFAIEMGINVPGIESRIERSEARRVAQPLLDLRHQRKEVGHIPLVEGLSQFGQHELAPAWNFGNDDPRPIPPVKLTDFRAARRDGLAGRRGFGAGLIVAALAAKTTIGITLGLLGFVVAVFDVSFGVAEGPWPKRSRVWCRVRCTR